MFFGFPSQPNYAFPENSIKRTPFNACTPGRRCRGSLPLSINGEKKTRFIYHDGEPDDGVMLTKCTVEWHGNTYCWFEE